MKEFKFRYIFKNKLFGDFATYYMTLTQVETGGTEEVRNSGMTAMGYELVSRDIYIGKEDKNGKEIYDGDIIKSDRRDNVAVEYNGLGAEFTYKNPDKEHWIKRYIIGWGDMFEPEVIGNKTENPDLLK